MLFGMTKLSRRQFAGASALGAAFLAGRSNLLGDPMGLPIGCQTWPVRNMIGKDFDGTLKQLATDGFRAIELCSPPGYKAMGFGPLASMKGSELKAKIEGAGLRCESCHFGFDEIRKNLDERLAWAKEVGLKQMIIAAFGVPKSATMAQWVSAAQDANKAGEQALKAGIQLGYHNHDMEFEKLDGELIYDKLLSEFDPKLVKLQFQVGVIRAGYKAQDYLTKYPGRYISMHCQDWSPSDKKEVAMGKGIVDWKAVFAAAKKAGVKTYFVEMAPPAMQESVPYLHTLA